MYELTPPEAAHAARIDARWQAAWGDTDPWAEQDARDRAVAETASQEGWAGYADADGPLDNADVAVLDAYETGTYL